MMICFHFEGDYRIGGLRILRSRWLGVYWFWDWKFLIEFGTTRMFLSCLFSSYLFPLPLDRFAEPGKCPGCGKTVELPELWGTTWRRMARVHWAAPAVGAVFCILQFLFLHRTFFTVNRTSIHVVFHLTVLLVLFSVWKLSFGFTVFWFLDRCNCGGDTSVTEHRLTPLQLHIAILNAH